MAALIVLDRERVLYAYAYFPSLMIGYALAAIAWRSTGLNDSTVRVGLGAITVTFLLSVTLTFHWDVPQAYCRIFLRNCGT